MVLVLGFAAGQDPVFSNVIATPDAGLKLVDMRGKLGDVLTIRGDCMYDFAKTYQSVCGYDFVLLDRAMCESYIEEVRAAWNETAGWERKELPAPKLNLKSSR